MLFSSLNLLKQLYKHSNQLTSVREDQLSNSEQRKHANKMLMICQNYLKAPSPHSLLNWLLRILVLI